MEWSRFLRVYDMALVQEIVVSQLQYDAFQDSNINTFQASSTHLVAEEAARDVDLFTSYNDNLLTRENLFGYNRCQPAEEMAFTVNDDWAGGDSSHGRSLDKMFE